MIPARVKMFQRGMVETFFACMDSNRNMGEHLLQTPHSLGIPLSSAISSSAEQDDALLVAASKRGDQEAFALLVQRYQRRVFNLVFGMLQQYEEASEITQEAFLAAWQGLPAFRGEARFSTWLHRIAYNCALKQLEQRRRDQALQASLAAEQLVGGSGERHADAIIESHARQALVHEQLSQLPAKYRIVLILRHLQEMTYEEMAEILTMPIGTIKTHLFRARNLLKERLEAIDREITARTRGY
jgi:RNA polymerase sigma-70 factor, ECF subfamily